MAALTAALMATQAAGAVSQYGQQKRSANYEAAVAGQNAGLADQQAAQALYRGDEAANRARAEGRQIVGSQRAGYAGGGVDVATGSPVDVAGDTSRISELDAMTLKNNATLEAYGYKVQAAGYRADQQNAQQRSRDSYTTLLTGATNAFSTYAANRSSASDPFGDKQYAQWGKSVARAKVGRK